MQVIWKDVIGYENDYQVSNFGDTRSKDRYVEYKHGGKSRFWPSKLLCIWIPKNGYPSVTLKKKDCGTNFMVHRLVGIHFIENKGDGWQINHKDGNKKNNRVDNLEWVSQQDNMKHAFKIGLHKGKGATHYKTKKITDGINIYNTNAD